MITCPTCCIPADQWH